MKSSQFLALAALLGFSGTVSAAWTRLASSSDARPVNLAAKAIHGTKILASKGVSEAGNLLLGDPAAAAHVSGGKSEVTLQLSKQQIINLVTFVNDGAEGKVTCAGSPDEKNWTTLGTAVFSAGERTVSLAFASAQAKYVSISFDSAQGGSIRGLRVYGAPTEKSFTLKSSPASGVSINLASSPGGAHPIYAFPTPSNVGELDYRYNVFRFPSTGDKYRTIVYDLGAPRTIREFSSAYSQHPVRLEVFAFQELPETKDWRGKMTLDPAIFDKARPVAVGEDSRGLGHIKVYPAKPVTAQYIALRFEPNYQHAGSGVFDASWGQLAELTLGSAGPVLRGFDLLPDFRLTAGGGSFTVSDVSIGGDGYSVGGGGGNGGNDGEGGGNGNGGGGNDGESNNNTNGAPPYLPGTPGAPPASTGGLPLGTTGSTGSGNTTTTPNNVTVHVNSSGNNNTGGGNTGGTNANPPPTNPPSTENP